METRLIRKVLMLMAKRLYMRRQGKYGILGKSVGLYLSDSLVHSSFEPG